MATLSRRRRLLARRSAICCLWNCPKAVSVSGVQIRRYFQFSRELDGFIWEGFLLGYPKSASHWMSHRRPQLVRYWGSQVFRFGKMISRRSLRIDGSCRTFIFGRNGFREADSISPRNSWLGDAIPHKSENKLLIMGGRPITIDILLSRLRPRFG